MSVPPQLHAIFQEVFDDPTLVVHPHTCPDDIPDWDSVAQVKLLLAIEEACGVRFSIHEVSQIHSVGDFISALNKGKDSAA